MTNNNFNNNLKTTGILVDSIDYPKIKSGGSSSSSVLNRFHDLITKDIGSILVYLNRMVDRSTRIADASSAQSAALNAPLTSLNSRVDTLLDDSSFVMADFFTSNYISTSGSDTVADVSSLFGYVTLPITSSTNLLLHTDSYGNNQVSSEVQLSYTTQAVPQNYDFVNSSNGLDMLLRKNVWLIDAPGRAAWIKIKAPLQYLGLNPNVLELYPFPAFGADIESVQYQRAGAGLGGEWVDVDISYVPGYNTGTQKIEAAGPLRIYLEGEPISQIRFKMTPKGDYRFGLYDVKVLSNSYSQSGTLTVKDPDSRTIDGLTIYGKDPEDLANLSTSLTANKARIELVSTSTYKTPVINRVVLSL